MKTEQTVKESSYKDMIIMKDSDGNLPKNYISMDSFPEIKGYDFNQKFNFNDFMESYQTMGFQGSNFGHAVTIFKEILEQKNKGLKVWMSFTGNMISSGNREIIKFLVENKIIDGIVTSTAAIEEDIIKLIKPFHLGSYDVQGKFLFDECVGRIGNIFVPYDRYLYFEEFFNDLFNGLLEKGKNNLSPREITREIGKFIKTHKLTKEKHTESFLFHAAKNNIPVYCPCITDGALGDISTFLKKRKPEFGIEITKDNATLTATMQNIDKAAAIILGGGTSKHFLMNAAIFREGFDYSIYITTAHEFDGSDSGGNHEEAISWAKIKPNAKRVKIIAEATLLFPLLVASSMKEIKAMQ